MVSPLRRDALREIVGIGVLMGVAAAAIASQAGFGAGYLLKAAVVYLCGAALAWRGLALAHPHPRFGPANRVTALRFAMSALLAGVIGEPLLQPDAIAWVIVVAATVTAVLDAADGPLARRSGMASDFGARFDMETDAAFTLVLCALVLQAGQAGPWVLASGLMRYAFVAAARAWPWLAGALPPSRRRQTVCVVQITTLIVCLGPTVPPPLAAGLAGISLVLLTLSFAIDVRTLARQRHTLLEA